MVIQGSLVAIFFIFDTDLLNLYQSSVMSMYKLLLNYTEETKSNEF